jgi:hypothetical protein
VRGQAVGFPQLFEIFQHRYPAQSLSGPRFEGADYLSRERL